MYKSLKHIIKACKKDDPKAQKVLYDQFAARHLGVCKRYIKDHGDAEYVMLEGFYKILTKINTFSNKGSFEGWMRRIMVNESLMFLRKRVNYHMVLESNSPIPTHDISIDDQLAYEDLLKILDLLPDGYRTVFNMYVIEGYKHKEIAEVLNISISTSKTQLLHAKKRLQHILEKKTMHKWRWQNR